MKPRRLIWKLYPSFVFISLASLIAVTLIACLSFRSFYYHQKELDLSARAHLVKEQFLNLINEKQYLEIQNLSKRSGKGSLTRLTVLLPSGQVLGDSEKDPSEMDNHKNRPEIQAVFENKKQGIAIRYSHTLKEELMYFALPLISEHKIQGVLRVAIPLTGVQNALWRIYYRVFVGFLILLILVASVSWMISRKLSRPLEMMKRQAEHIAEGDFSKKISLHPSAPQESFDLANAMNKITGQLTQRMEEILKAKNEQEAVFSSISEGIIAIDRNEKIIHFNQAACKILSIQGTGNKSLGIEEQIRNHALQQFINFSLNNDGPCEKELELQNGETRLLHIQSSPLLDSKGEQLGIVLVIQDLTKIRTLENHRREFVANVSHELRTPLTSIQGFSETLLNPTVSDANERDEFLKIIHDHASRLGAIIDDLLSLSEIEKESSKEIEMTEAFLKPPIESAISLCQTKAKEGHTRFHLNCPEEIRIKMNAALLEQALVNLLVNSIKYGKDGGEIQVSVKTRDSVVIISVTDQGIGIAQEHLPRLFERFYRVDKARSRTLGGTGLGLSIVKHIAQAHHGKVDVQSTVGKGSTFSMILPV